MGLKYAVWHAGAGSRGGARGAHSHLLHWLLGFGAAGLFTISLIDASVIPLPLPGSTDLLLLFLVARSGNPWVLALAAIAGAILGGYLTWDAGRRGGEAILEHYAPERHRGRIGGWVRSHGVLTMCVAALIPPPVPMVPLLLAGGAMGVSRSRFLLAFGLAKTFRYGMIAWLGAVYGRRLADAWIAYLHGWGRVILWTAVGLLVAGVLYGLWRHWRRGGAARKNGPA